MLKFINSNILIFNYNFRSKNFTNLGTISSNYFVTNKNSKKKTSSAAQVNTSFSAAAKKSLIKPVNAHNNITGGIRAALTINSFLSISNSKPRPYRSCFFNYGSGAKELYFNSGLPSDFITNKILVNGGSLQPKFLAQINSGDDLPLAKYTYYWHCVDPVYGSWLLEKLINVFFKHGKKERIRKVFNNIFLSNKYNYSIDTLYHIIGMLRVNFLNVKIKSAGYLKARLKREEKLAAKRKATVLNPAYQISKFVYRSRRGPAIIRYKGAYSNLAVDTPDAKEDAHWRFGTAPMPASDLKSTIKAIHFFKRAVLDNKYEETFERKILCEIENIFFGLGYYNRYHSEYEYISDKTKFLSHFRAKTMY